MKVIEKMSVLLFVVAGVCVMIKQLLYLLLVLFGFVKFLKTPICVLSFLDLFMNIIKKLLVVWRYWVLLCLGTHQALFFILLPFGRA